MLATKRSAGVAPDVNLRYPFYTVDKAHKKGSPEVGNRIISGPTERTDVLEKIFYPKNSLGSFLDIVFCCIFKCFWEVKFTPIIRWKKIRWLVKLTLWYFKRLNDFKLICLTPKMHWSVQGALPTVQADSIVHAWLKTHTWTKHMNERFLTSLWHQYFKLWNQCCWQHEWLTSTIIQNNFLRLSWLTLNNISCDRHKKNAFE